MNIKWILVKRYRKKLLYEVNIFLYIKHRIKKKCLANGYEELFFDSANHFLFTIITIIVLITYITNNREHFMFKPDEVLNNCVHKKY